MAPEAGARWRRLAAYGLAGLGFSALALLLLQLLVGRRLAAQREQQLSGAVAAQLVLGEVALERFTPATLAAIGGLRLAVGPDPDPRPAAAAPGRRRGLADPLLQRQALALQRSLCRRLERCPAVRPARQGPRGVWVAMASPLEAVWLFAPLPPLPGWPPDPLLLALALGVGGLSSGLLHLSHAVQRPLRRLEQALAGVNLQPGLPVVVPPEGSQAVRRLTGRFNAMVERLDRAGREQTTMLAGIAHDLRAPLTRLRLRLDLAPAAGLAADDCRRSLADLAALERITSQFLRFAGLDQGEPAVVVPLAALLAEVAAAAGAVPLELALEPLERRVRPTALARAVANLLDNALAHGAPPLCLELRGEDATGFTITLWDHGPGIPASAWSRALEPFQRLDPSRGDQGHCGLGLAIAERIARDHGGGLEPRHGPRGFGVVLRGRSLQGS
jgi:two-component system osmolarity sensor histidine kinase EnvZ